MHVPAQVTRGSLLREGLGQSYLVFVLPKLKAGETVDGHADHAQLRRGAAAVRVRREEGRADRTVYGGVNGKRKVLQYFNLPHDPKDHYYTFKPFHNVFDPARAR